MRCLVSVCALVLTAAATPRSTVAQPSRPNAGTAARADAIDAATRTAVLAARDAIWRAWFAHDSVALAKLLPSSTTAGDARGWQSRDTIVDESRQSAASGRKLVGLKFADTRIHKNGEVVVVFSTYTLELEHQGQRNTVTGSASEVFVLEDGVWRNPFWYLGPR